MLEERKFSPGPFIKSFLDKSQRYPKTKHYSENCYAKVMVILFLNSEGRGSVKRKKTHTESNINKKFLQKLIHSLFLQLKNKLTRKYFKKIK